MIVDAAIVGLVGFAVLRGGRRGVASWFVNWIGFIAAVVAAVYGYRAVAAPLRAFGVGAGFANLTGALAIFLGVTAAAWIGGRALTRLLRLTKWGTLNRAGGAAIAGAWAVSWVTAVLLVVSVVPVPKWIESGVRTSALGSAIVENAPVWLDTFARTDLRRLVVSFLPGERPPSSLAATLDFRRSPPSERDLFDLANAERSVRGVRLLAWDERLADAARVHAADMYRRGYFSHRSPDGREPVDRLRDARVPFRVTGENLAVAPSARAAHNRLMRSPTHRRVLLDPRFDRLGVGVMYGPHGLVVAQEYAA